MKKWYEVKVRARLGPEPKDDKEATLLGRVVRCEDWGLTCEADPKHREMVLDALGLQHTSKSLTTPGTKEEQGGGRTQQAHVRVAQKPREDTRYRAIVARLNYMAADMPDIRFACKEACREMSRPSDESWERQKIGRYTVGWKRVVWSYPWARELGRWRVCADSDWAGDLKTRKSTSGGILMLGEHCIKTWSCTQDPLAMSSCEAEHYALAGGALEAASDKLATTVEGATRALGAQAVAKELGVDVDDLTVELATDSSAAKSFASRRGLGRNRHVEVKWLWLQSAVAQGKFRLRKIPGAMNPADVCTKYQSLSDMRERLWRVNVQVDTSEPRAVGQQLGGIFWMPALWWLLVFSTHSELRCESWCLWTGAVEH